MSMKNINDIRRGRLVLGFSLIFAFAAMFCNAAEEEGKKAGG